MERSRRMKQTTAYGVRIHAASMKPVQDMVRIYRQAVTFLIKVCNEQWNSISDIPFLVRKQSFMEGLIHHTKNRTRVQYDQFDVLFYKLPSYMCRAAISEAIGAVASYSLKVV